MRVLFTTQPGVGHFHPLVPLIHALTGAGHEVGIACSPSFAPVAASCDVPVFPAGLDVVLGSNLEDAFPDLAAIPPGPGRVAFMLSKVFAGMTAERMADSVIELSASWPFDLIVRETMEFGGYLAAEKLDLPHAVVQTTPHRQSVLASIRTPLNAHRAHLGLPADPDVAALTRYLHLSLRPPSLQGTPVPPNSHGYRAPVFDRSVAQDAPAWANAPMASPVIFASLGTIATLFAGELLQTMLDAARPLAGTVILAVGPDVDPAMFGPQPGHIHIERYVPQSLVFPRCDLVITHGGSGSMMAALSHGLPMVVIPIAADQPDNAGMLASEGLARVVGPDERTTALIGDAIRAVLGDPSYRLQAELVRDEMEAFPDLEYAVGLLERLAREKAPIPASM